MRTLGNDDGRGADTTARWARVDDNLMARARAPMIERLMDLGIDGRGPFGSARTVAGSS